VIDTGALGRVAGGTAFFACPGHEYWHLIRPSTTTSAAVPCSTWALLHHGPGQSARPHRPGAGPELTPFSERPVRSEPKKGQMMPVSVATHVTGTLVFASGALVQVTLSDVPTRPSADRALRH
jgi:hypothetical protein